MAKRKEKIEVDGKVRRKLAAKFDKTETTIYSWLNEMEEGTATGTILKCRELAVALGGRKWYSEEEETTEQTPQQ